MSRASFEAVKKGVPVVCRTWGTDRTRNLLSSRVVEDELQGCAPRRPRFGRSRLLLLLSPVVVIIARLLRRYVRCEKGKNIAQNARSRPRTGIVQNIITQKKKKNNKRKTAVECGAIGPLYCTKLFGYEHRFPGPVNGKVYDRNRIPRRVAQCLPHFRPCVHTKRSCCYCTAQRGCYRVSTISVAFVSFI